MKLTMKSFTKRTNESNPKPAYRGFVDKNVGPVIKGWAVKSGCDNPVWVKITYGNITKCVAADEYRPDVKRAGIHNTGRCGFTVQFNNEPINIAHIDIIEAVFHLDNSHLDLSNRKIFFLHIPKTAGSSMNQVMTDVFGATESETHIESRLDNPSALLEKKFLSGHVDLNFFFDVLQPHGFVCGCMLRSPYEQLISHLNWVRRLDEPGNYEFASKHPKIVRKIAAKLNMIDWTNVDEIKGFVSNMNLVEKGLFDNLQTRYLSSQRQGPLTSKHLQLAKQNLGKMHLFGLSEKFNETLEDFGMKMGRDLSQYENTKENVSMSKKMLNTDNDKIRTVLNQIIEKDIELYNFGLELISIRNLREH